jgi:hypothetical protein
VFESILVGFFTLYDSKIFVGHMRFGGVTRKDSNNVALFQSLLNQRSTSASSSAENKQFHRNPCLVEPNNYRRPLLTRSKREQPHRLDTFAGPNTARLFDLFGQAKHGLG